MRQLRFSLRVTIYFFISVLVFTGCSKEDQSTIRPASSIDVSGNTQGPGATLKPAPINYTQSTLSIPFPLNDTYYGTTGKWSNIYRDIWGFDDVGVASQFSFLTLPIQELIVAVIDSGVDYDHPDLQGRLWINSGERGNGRENNGIDDDGDGYIDDFMGWNWVDNNNHPVDDLGHGTHVAGIVGAIGGNGVGTIGIAPWVRIMSLKACSYQGLCDSTDVRAAISYAVSHGAKVINLSLGGPAEAADSAAYDAAITTATNAGTLVVVAAGNSHTDTLQFTPSDAKNAMSVSAYASDGNLCSSFSNYGWKIDVSAPGCGYNGVAEISGILSLNSLKCSTTGTANCCSSRFLVDTNYCLKKGTSMSTPYAVGLAALVWTADENATPYMVRQAILQSARRTSSMNSGDKNLYYGRGKLDAEHIIAEVRRAPGLKILSPSFNVRSSSFAVQFHIEARSSNLSYVLREVPYSGGNNINLSSGAVIANSSGNVLARDATDIIKTWLPTALGTYALVLDVESSGEHYYDLVIVEAI